MIKGGGGAHTLEKIVAQNSKLRIYMVEEAKVSNRIGDRNVAVPVEVLPEAYKSLLDKLNTVGKSGEKVIEAWVRPAKEGKAGPIITDNGCFIVDAKGPGVFEDLKAFESIYKSVAGVIEVGLFTGIADIIFIGKEDGTHSQLTRNALARL